MELSENSRDFGLVYLGSPYTKYPAGIEAAFKDVSNLAARLVAEGFIIFSPIAHSHVLAEHSSLPTLDYNVWLGQDFEIIRRCDTMFLATMTGWEESYGMHKEIEHALALGKPIYTLDPEMLTLEPYLRPDAALCPAPATHTIPL